MNWIQFKIGLLLLSVFLASHTLAHPTETVSRAPLYLEIGEQRALSFPALLRFSVSGKAIHYTRLKDSNQILMKAIEPGVAQIEVLEGPNLQDATISTRQIRVEQKKNLGHSPALLQALSQLNHLEVIDTGKRLALRGEISRYSDALVVAELRDQYPDQISDETSISADWWDRIRAPLRAIVSAHPHLEIDFHESSVLIHGSLPHPEDLKNIERQIRAIQPLAHFDVQTIKEMNPTLYFKVYLLEMKRETLRSLGVKWPTEHPLSLQVATGEIPSWSIGGPTQIDLSVQALSERGELRILSSPELVVRCPGQAELFAGGELPIRQHSKFNDSVIWKGIGLSLKLEPKELGGERVRLNIETELSHLDAALTNDKIPGIQSNRIKTQVDASMGRPLFLSGLLQDDWRKSVRGLAGLADIPVLGALFSSEDFQNERSELVAVLVPSRQSPSQPTARLGTGLPRGFLPVAREPVSFEKLDEWKQSSTYPWNALQ